MAQKKELAKIVGAKNVFDDSQTLERYSKDQSFTRSCKPDLVVKPASVEQVKEIVRTANKYNIPITPYSSGLNLHGATIPDQGGIILDLSRMNKVEEINERNWFAVVQPGVTYEQLEDEVEKYGLRVMIPWGVPPKRSVLSSYMEREPSVAAAHRERGNALYLDTEIILPYGEIFRTGKWYSETITEPGQPQGPMGQLAENYRLWTGAQGTLGIVTRLVLILRYLSELRRFFFIPFYRLEDVTRLLSRVLRFEVGTEWFALNSFNLAALFTDDWKVPDEFPCEKIPSQRFGEIRRRLPPWILAICLEGLPYFPQEKVKYEENVLREECAKEGVEPLTMMEGLPKIQEVFLREIIRPWGILKKFCYKGSVHDVNFYAPLRNVPKFVSAVNEVAVSYGYPIDDIGGYVLPLEWGRASYCELDFHRDQSNTRESAMVKELLSKANETLIDMGAVPAKLYVEVADITYRKANPNWVQKQKEIKKTLDKNNIMNPGKLCFNF